MIRIPPVKSTAGAILAASIFLQPAEAAACGGFFCSQSQPVNQAAERIVFAQHDDDTVTAVIQIMYEGPSESFSWLLPLSSVPEADEIAVSSDVAFQRLQAATNPTYTLTTRVEGDCKTGAERGAAGTPPPSVVADGNAQGPGAGVMVEASGIVGSFEWTVISFDPSLDDPADAAVEWLSANDYDVTEQGARLIGPYLEEGMYLLALKLVKGADAGSIRPIVLSYDAGEPMIPIKLTAVAANDDMGVMTWLLANERAVPKNYLALELNEAQINWFNAASNYNDVVIAAADEAGGQGFVTEFAGASEALREVIWSSSEEQIWSDVRSRVYTSFSAMFDQTFGLYGSFDGFWDAVRTSVTLPDDVNFDDFQLCPSCYYSSSLELSPSEYFNALEQQVIEPVRLMQQLFDEHAYTTRLYTTMSAADMTADPAFTFNGDLPDVDNVHTAERITECNPSVYEWEAPWRIELPQGGVIRGTADEANAQIWPEAVREQPANFSVQQLSASGQGMLLADNSQEIERSLTEYNDSLNLPQSRTRSDSGGCSMSSVPSQPSHVLLGLLGLSLAALWRKPSERRS